MIRGIFASAGVLALLAALGGCDKADGFADVAPQPPAHTAGTVKATTASRSKPVQAPTASIESLKAANDRAAQEKAAAVNACLARVHQGDTYKALDKQATELRAVIALDKYQDQTAKMNADWAKLLPVLTQITRLESNAVDDDPIAREAVSKAAAASAAYASALRDQQAEKVSLTQAQTASAVLSNTAMPDPSSPAYAAPSSNFGGYSGSAPKTVHVDGYTRKDGTYVHSYNRSAPHSGGGGGRRR